jgi:hypothetical protein
MIVALVNTIAIDSSTYSKSLDSKSIKQVLEKNKQSDGIVNAEVFNELLTRSDIPHVLMTETKQLIKKLESEFPEMISVSSIGSTKGGNSI